MIPVVVPMINYAILRYLLKNHRGRPYYPLLDYAGLRTILLRFAYPLLTQRSRSARRGERDAVNREVRCSDHVYRPRCVRMGRRDAGLWRAREAERREKLHHPISDADGLEADDYRL